MPIMNLIATDTNVVVKDSAAWVVGHVAEVFPDIALTDTVLNTILAAMSMGLEMEPRVASNCCHVS